MFTIGYLYNGETLYQEVEDWKKIVKFLRLRGCKILYVYYTENHKPVFVYKGD